MAQVAHTQETGYERMIRLAAKARKEGVELLHSAKTNQYFATSGTQAGTRYAVTPHSCECKGHARFGYCKHRAALQTALGWIEQPEATPATASADTVCRHCDGRGFQITAQRVSRFHFERVDVPCSACHPDSGKAVA